MDNFKKKRAISAVVATIFFIVISVILVVIAFSFIRNYNIKEAQPSLNCIKDVDIEILDVCYQANLLKIKIKNRNDIILGDFFLIRITYNDGSEDIIPTSYHTYIQPYSTETIIVPYYKETEKIKVIPRIEKQAYLCPEAAPEFKNIEECK